MPNCMPRTAYLGFKGRSRHAPVQCRIFGASHSQPAYVVDLTRLLQVLAILLVCVGAAVSPLDALAQASGDKSSAGKSNTGKSNTGKSNTGQSNTGQSNKGKAVATAVDPEAEAEARRKADRERLELESLLLEHQQKDAETLRFLQALARQREDKGDFASAAQVYAHLGGVFPDDSFWAFKTSQMYAFAGDLDRSIALGRALLDREPQNLDAGLLLSRTYAWNSQWTQAEQVIIELEARYPNEPALDKARGDLLYYQGRFREARRHYERYLEHRSQDPDALQALARCHLALGDLERAEELKAPLQEAGQAQAVEQIEAATQTSDAPFRFDLSPRYSYNAERPDWFGARATLSYQVSDAVNLGAGFDIWSRRDIDSTDVTLLLIGGFRFGKRFSMEAEIGFTPGADFRPTFMARVVPRVSVVDWFDIFLFYQVMLFNDGVGPDNDLWVNQIGPGLGFHFGPVSFDISYRLTLFDEDSLDLGHLGVLDLRVQLTEMWALMGSAAYGANTEVFFDPAPVIRDTLTLMGGVEVQFDWRQGLRGMYTFFTTDPPREDPGGLYQHTFTLHYWVRF